ncbi:MAG: MGMT family protein [Gemmatimonadetes bacterium]|nr:MGMT family protein [Gemmatimonadota bacterium]
MSDFDSILDYVRKIPPGKTMSYGDVAKALDTSALAVGVALKTCPLDTPWWRVTKGGGLLHPDLDMDLRCTQVVLLQREGVPVTMRVPQKWRRKP